MATIDDYVSGKICEQINLGLSILESSEGPLAGSKVGKVLLRNINKSAPTKLSSEEAINLINKAERYAIGERVCRVLHKETLLTEIVFLEELAKGMVEAGKARFVSKQEAIENIIKYKKSPFIVSKVSGQHSEICPTWPRKCIYWNMEKHKLKCIHRKPSSI